MNCRKALAGITVAQGSQGPRTYRFSAQRVRATRRRKPGKEPPSGAGTWTATPRYYLSIGRGWVQVAH